MRLRYRTFILALLLIPATCFGANPMVLRGDVDILENLSTSSIISCSIKYANDYDAAVTAVNALDTEVILLLDEVATASSAATTDSEVTVIGLPSGGLDTGGYAIAFGGPFVCGEHTFFSGYTTSNVTMLEGSTVHHIWWGDDSDALTAAMASGASECIINQDFTATATITFPEHITLRGRNSEIKITFTGTGACLEPANKGTEDTRQVLFTLFSIDASTNINNNIIGIDFTGVHDSEINKIHFNGFDNNSGCHDIYVDGNNGSYTDGAHTNKISFCRHINFYNGITLDGVSGNGQSNSNDITNNDFLASGTAGINIENLAASNTTIAYCKFQGLTTGIEDDGTYSTIFSNLFEGNTTGINVAPAGDGSDPIFIGNYYSSNTADITNTNSKEIRRFEASEEVWMGTNEIRGNSNYDTYMAFNSSNDWIVYDEDTSGYALQFDKSDESIETRKTFEIAPASGEDPHFWGWNRTEEDDDGGRSTTFRAYGEQSGGEKTTLGWWRFRHDGASDDEKGGWKVSVNDGDDADSPTVDLELYSDGSVEFPNGDSANQYGLRTRTYREDDCDDDETINLPDGVVGHGIVFCGNDTNEEGAVFAFYDDNPVIISGTANAQEADADGKLVIMDGGNTVTIKNTMGDNYVLSITIWYFTPS